MKKPLIKATDFLGYLDEVPDYDNNEARSILEIEKIDLDSPQDKAKWKLIKNHPKYFRVIEEKKSISNVNKTGVILMEFRDYTCQYNEILTYIFSHNLSEKIALLDIAHILQDMTAPLS